jgi:MFS family permease
MNQLDPVVSPAAPKPAAPAGFSKALFALILGQIFLHSCMAGVRVAAPLLALRTGHPQWAIGILLGLFAAAPVLTSLRAGRLADQHGYHFPMRIAVGLTSVGGLLAVMSTWLTVELAALQFPVLGLAATLCGVGANFGLIAIQRTAGRMTSGSGAELTRVFSWMGLAPALSNMIGPVVAGVMIDLSGFRGAFIALMLLPLLSLWWARQVPVEKPEAKVAVGGVGAAWKLFNTPGFRRLMFVNWLLSSSWDLHSFVVPILGHERGFSASAIGFILGGFAAAVTLVRFAIPLLLHRAPNLSAGQVLARVMLMTAAVFVVYPWVHSAWLMGLCAVCLGLALGSVQPMIMTALHQLTPKESHGQAIALRSMTINTSSALMPLMFGVFGGVLGAASLFWVMAVGVAAGSWPARRIRSEQGHSATPAVAAAIASEADA